MSEHAGDEPYLRVEDIAERFGLPLAVLLRRVEAGDVPSHRIDTEDGPRYSLRLSDLGIETDEATTSADGAQSADIEEPEGINAFDEADWNGGRGRVTPEPAWQGEQASAQHTIIAPAWSTRPLEPQQPPVWITADPGRALDHSADESEQHEPEQREPEQREPVDAPWIARAEPPAPAETPAEAPPAEEPPAPAATEPGPSAAPGELHPPAVHAAELHPVESLPPAVTAPVPVRAPASSLIDPLGGGGPRTDLASMSLDARDLVAGLLDRWERTLEQRIYTEQRQRFQVELSARQNMVRELQMELQTARAEHAAAQAEKDRLLAAKERELADRERDLAETRRYVEEAERGGGSPDARRRRWFRARGDD
jgi:hypothetical protein